MEDLVGKRRCVGGPRQVHRAPRGGDERLSRLADLLVPATNLAGAYEGITTEVGRRAACCRTSMGSGRVGAQSFTHPSRTWLRMSAALWLLQHRIDIEGEGSRDGLQLARGVAGARWRHPQRSSRQGVPARRKREQRTPGDVLHPLSGDARRDALVDADAPTRLCRVPQSSWKPPSSARSVPRRRRPQSMRSSGEVPAQDLVSRRVVPARASLPTSVVMPSYAPARLVAGTRRSARRETAFVSSSRRLR